MADTSRPCMVIYEDYQAVGVLEQTYEDTISLFQCFIPALTNVPTSTFRISTSLACPLTAEISNSLKSIDGITTTRKVTLWSHPRAWQAAMAMWDADEAKKVKSGDGTLRAVWVEVIESDKEGTNRGGAILAAIQDRCDASEEKVKRDLPTEAHPKRPKGIILDSAMPTESATPTPQPQSLVVQSLPTKPQDEATSLPSSPSGQARDIFPWGKSRNIANLVKPIEGLPSPRPSPARTPSSIVTSAPPSRPTSMGKRISWVSIIEKPFKSSSYQARDWVIPDVPSPEKAGSGTEGELTESPAGSNRSSYVDMTTPGDFTPAIPAASPVTTPYTTIALRDHSAQDFQKLLPFPRSNSYTNVTSANSSRINLNDTSSFVQTFSAPATPLRTPPHSRATSFTAGTRPPAFRRASTDASDSELRRNSTLAPQTELLADGYLENRSVEKPRLRAVRESNGGAKYSYGGGSYTGMAQEIKIHIRPVDEWRSAQTITVGRYQPLSLAFSHYTKAKASSKNARYSFIWEGNKLAADEGRTPHDLGIRESLTVDAYSRKME